MDIKENVSIHESHIKFTGIVTILDENGNIVVENHNLIVESGRKLMAAALTGGAAFNIENLQIIYGLTTDSSVSPDATLPGDYKTITPSVTKSDDGLSVKFTVQLNHTSSNSDSASKLTFNYIGLATTGDKPVLFSKSIFNTVILPPSRTMEINYTIYF